MQVDTQRIEGFLLELDDASQVKALFLLRLLESSRLPFLPAPHGEKVERDLYALLIMTKLNVRLYYTVVDGKAVMLCGIYKGQQKIPMRTLRHCRHLIALVHLEGA
jgi:hypothetical protein